MNKLFNEYSVDQSHVSNKRLRLPGYDRQQEYKSIKLLVAEHNYTRVHLVDKTHPLIVCNTLKFFADQMPEFVRANKGTLINPNIIKKAIVFNPKQMVLELTTGESVSVSRRRIATVLAQLSLPPIKPYERLTRRDN